MPLVIVAVVVAYVAAAWITPAETTGSATQRPAATAGSDSEVVSR
jgi:hypothetical protein